MLSAKVGTVMVITEIGRLSEAKLSSPDITICVKNNYFNIKRYENGSAHIARYYKEMTNHARSFLEATHSGANSSYTVDQTERLTRSAQWSWHVNHERTTFETEILVECSFLGHECNIHDYNAIGSVGESSCLHFSLRAMQERLAGRVGVHSQGLSFTISLPCKDLTSETAESILYIHEPGTYPDFTTGVTIPNFQKLYVYLTTYHIEYYSRPAFRCRNDLPGIQVQMTNGSLKTFAYTETLCRARLFQAQVLQRCRCFSELVPSAVDPSVSMQDISGGCHDLPAQFFDEKWPINDSRLAAYVQRQHCHEREYLKYSDSVALSVCPKPCRIISYDTEITRSTFIAMSLYLSKLPALARRARVVRPEQNITLWDSVDRFAKDSAKKRGKKTPTFVSCPTMKAAIALSGEVFRSKQEALDSTSVVVGMCGSVLGLWFGASVISACEFFEFGFSCIVKKHWSKRDTSVKHH